MKEKLIRFLTSYKAAIFLMAAYAFFMGIATFVEKESGTATAKALIYYSPLFILLHLLMIVNFIGISIQNKYFTPRKWGYACVHLAFIVILTGAMVTHTLGKEGILHLREGERSNTVVVKQGETQVLEYLPFEVELLDFKLTRYPGSQSPSSYESILRLHTQGTSFEKKIYMNHVLDLEGFRFFQASYDTDELGTILSVSHDVTGRTITYLGYAILLLGFIGCFVSKGSRFRRLCNQLNASRIVILLIGLSCGSPLFSSTLHFSEEHTESFGKLPMQDFRGRIIPVHTFACELSRKLDLSQTLPDYNENEVLLRLITEPTRWAHYPLIHIDDKELKQHLGLKQDFISYREAFTPQGDYKWSNQVESIYQKNAAQRARLEREVLKLDEKINLLHQIFNYRLVRIFPVPKDSLHHQWVAAGDDQVSLPSSASAEILRLFKEYRIAVIQSAQSGEWKAADKALKHIQTYQQQNLCGLQLNLNKIEAEVAYNRLNLLSPIQKGYLLAGGLLVLLSLLSWFSSSERKICKWLKRILLLCVIIGFLGHTFSLGMRGYISGHAPWSNSYETMVFLSWGSILGGLCFVRRNGMAFALSTLFGGVVLFVSGLSWMDPEITPLVPVLKSPWLMFHVAVLMMAYGFLGLSCMIGTTNLLTAACMTSQNKIQIGQQLKKLTVINEISIYIGLALMTIGIFLGAIWANESWGRYWSWDPKETWALITTIIYAIILHIRWFNPKSGDTRFNWLTQIGFLAVLMTYFGVNYLLSGMHSYGNTNGLKELPITVWILFILFFLLPGIAAYANKRIRKI